VHDVAVEGLTYAERTPSQAENAGSKPEMLVAGPARPDWRTAAFIFPIALAVARDLGVNFMRILIMLMLGTSYTFVNRVQYQRYQTSLMVYRRGAYTCGDFANGRCLADAAGRRRRARAGINYVPLP
jgi:hypothetical protein